MLWAGSCLKRAFVVLCASSRKRQKQSKEPQSQANRFALRACVTPQVDATRCDGGRTG